MKSPRSCSADLAGEQAAEVVQGKVRDAGGVSHGLGEATPRIHRGSIACERDQEGVGRGVGGLGEKTFNNGARFAHKGQAMLLGVLRAGWRRSQAPTGRPARCSSHAAACVGKFLSPKRQQ